MNDLQTVVVVFNALSKKIDPYNHHGPDVADLTRTLLLRARHHPLKETEMIISGAHLHDLAKAFIPLQYWLEPRALNENERHVMMLHPALGKEFCHILGLHPIICDVVGDHHENWDGSGYPAHKKGVEISYGARVVRIADTYKALTSDRPYRKARTPAQALEEMSKHAHHYDPTLFTYLLAVVRETE